MFRKSGWGQVLFCGLLWMGSISRAEAQDPPGEDADQESTGWFDRFTRKDTEKPEPKPEDSSGTSEKLTPEQIASFQAREKAALLRREAVCFKLMQVALQLNDVRLQKRIEQLDDRAWQLYVQRTSRLTIGKSTQSDEQIISERARRGRNRRRDEEKLTERSRREQEEPRRRWSGLGGLFGGGDR